MRTRAKVITALVVLGAFAVAVLLLPLPSPAEVRAWAGNLGPGALAVFFVAYAVLTAAPIPRTVFNLAAGLLFGEFLGVAVAIVATALSGLLGFLLARWMGRDAVLRQLHRKPVQVVNDRLAHGGALAVASLRLIPVIPFAPLSYLCGISALRPRTYLAGTAVGSLPGTVAVVVLGDALTGTTPPALLACYVSFAALGALGLLRAMRAAHPETVAVAGDSRAGAPDAPHG